MNQAELLFDTQFPNAKMHMVRDGLIWVYTRKHEAQAAANFERDTSGLRGKIVISLTAILIFLLIF